MNNGTPRKNKDNLPNKLMNDVSTQVDCYEKKDKSTTSYRNLKLNKETNYKYFAFIYPWLLFVPVKLNDSKIHDSGNALRIVGVLISRELFSLSVDVSFGASAMGFSTMPKLSSKGRENLSSNPSLSSYSG